MATSCSRTMVLPITGRKLVAWQVDLRRRARPVRHHVQTPRVMRVSRPNGFESGDHTPDESGLLELSFCPLTWMRHDSEP